MSNFDPVDMSFHVPWDVCCNNLELEVVLNHTENIQCTLDLNLHGIHVFYFSDIYSLLRRVLNLSGHSKSTVSTLLTMMHHILPAMIGMCSFSLSIQLLFPFLPRLPGVSLV